GLAGAHPAGAGGHLRGGPVVAAPRRDGARRVNLGGPGPVTPRMLPLQTSTTTKRARGSAEVVVATRDPGDVRPPGRSNAPTAFAVAPGGDHWRTERCPKGARGDERCRTGESSYWRSWRSCSWAR